MNNHCNTSVTLKNLTSHEANEIPHVYVTFLLSGSTRQEIISFNNNRNRRIKLQQMKQKICMQSI